MSETTASVDALIGGTERYHRNCHHKMYRMTCAEFDALYAYAGGACQICETPEADTKRGLLEVDHDRVYGFRAVRGLLCSKCNSMMSRFDSRAIHDQLAARYCHDAWFINPTRRRFLERYVR